MTKAEFIDKLHKYDGVITKALFDTMLATAKQYGFAKFEMWTSAFRGKSAEHWQMHIAYDYGFTTIYIRFNGAWRVRFDNVIDYDSYVILCQSVIDSQVHQIRYY